VRLAPHEEALLHQAPNPPRHPHPHLFVSLAPQDSLSLSCQFSSRFDLSFVFSAGQFCLPVSPSLSFSL
jgi:hypothetical protein